MVSIKSIAVAAFAALPLASAYIYDIRPQTLTARAGDKVAVTVAQAIGLSTDAPLSIAYGFRQKDCQGAGALCLGRLANVTDAYLLSVAAGGRNYTDIITVPSLSAGTYTWVAIVSNVLGAEYTLDQDNYTSPFTITN